MRISRRVLVFVFIFGLFVPVLPVSAADTVLKPLVLGSTNPGTMDAALAAVKAAVTQQGFEVAGEYAPYKGAHVVVVTNEALKSNAGKSEFGAYGAAQRVSLTETPKGIQVSYTNPMYMAQAYRMKDGLADVAAALEKALGKQTEFGSADGLKAGKLRKYHYMMMMPYFDDEVKLGTFPSQEEALQVVETNLAARRGGCFKVYRVDVPGKKESVFGVGIAEGDGADATVMKVIDTGELKATAHLPYELIVADGSIMMLHGKFRIAVNFPDLGMGTFMKISGAPGGIEEKLKQVAGGK